MIPKTRTQSLLHFFIATFALIPLALSLQVLAQEPSDTLETGADTAQTVVAPVTSLIAEDHKYDNGEQIDLSWVPSIDDQPGIGIVMGYRVYRSTDGGEPVEIAELAAGGNSYADKEVERGHEYVYIVDAFSEDYVARSIRTESVTPKREWLNMDRKWLFLIALIIAGAVIFFVEVAKRGRELYIRKIAGLEAIDDAVGRATEMGRPVLFIPGIHDMDDVQTLAALTILSRVSRTIADYDTQIYMPVARSLVMTAGRETIKAAYMAAGRPDAYSDDMVTYMTDEQFGYVAAVDGIMVRERPATIFLLGAFFAESLILAETGNSVGAIQIAGTARPAQLPFFIAACDFTLIGEELFAASAYLSGEPRQLGSLKGQDVGKGIAMVIIIIGVLAATLSEAWKFEFMQDTFAWLTNVFSTR